MKLTLEGRVIQIVDSYILADYIEFFKFRDPLVVRSISNHCSRFNCSMYKECLSISDPLDYTACGKWRTDYL